jgi:hypothetical protein
VKGFSTLICSWIESFLSRFQPIEEKELFPLSQCRLREEYVFFLDFVSNGGRYTEPMA